MEVLDHAFNRFGTSSFTTSLPEGSGRLHCSFVQDPPHLARIDAQLRADRPVTQPPGPHAEDRLGAMQATCPFIDARNVFG